MIFTLGSKTKIKKKKFCNFRKQVPVGSFYMEHYYYNKKGKKNKKDNYFDILCLGGNDHYPDGQWDNYNNHSPSYLDHLKWIKKISMEFPKIKVGFKHHDNNRNDFEKNYFKNSKVIYINKKLNSYDLSINSNFVCSWASSMIFELLSIKNKSYFLDPNYQNIQFMKNIKKEIRINSYQKFKNIFMQKNSKKKFNLDKYCLPSNNTSIRIFKYLNKN